MKRTEQASSVLKAWKQVGWHLFPSSTEKLAARELGEMLKDDLGFIALRQAQETSTNGLIKRFQSLPYKEWQTEVQKLNGTLRACLLHRVRTYERFLENSAQEPITHDSDMGCFLEEALIVWWEKRDRSLYL